MQNRFLDFTRLVFGIFGYPKFPRKSPPSHIVFFFSFFRKKLTSRNMYKWHYVDPTQNLKCVYIWHHFDTHKKTICIYIAPFWRKQKKNIFACGRLCKKYVYIWYHFDPKENVKYFSPAEGCVKIHDCSLKNFSPCGEP